MLTSLAGPRRSLLAAALAVLLALSGLAACSSDTTPNATISRVGTPLPTRSGPGSGTPSGSANPATPEPGSTPAPTPGETAGPGGLDAAGVAALEARIDAAFVKAPLIGVSVAVRLPDGTVWTSIRGERRQSPRRAVDAETVFSIASITKTFVTAVVMQLVDEGKLSLDDTLDRWLPDFPRADRITIRELLDHTSGVYNYFESAKYNRAVFADPDRTWTIDQILALVRGPYCDPGTCWHYSNTNFVLLGRVAEIAGDQSLPKQIHTRLLDPLGLTHTGFQPDDTPPADAAHGHLYGSGGFIDQTRNSPFLPQRSAATVAWAAGAMFSDPSDLARWSAALYTGQVVPQPLVDQMLTFLPTYEYGLGTRTRIYNGRRAVGHLGSLRGYEDAMWYFPREGVSIVVLSNRGFWNPDRLVRPLARALFAHLDVPAPEFPPNRNTS